MSKETSVEKILSNLMKPMVESLIAGAIQAGTKQQNTGNKSKTNKQKRRENRRDRVLLERSFYYRIEKDHPEIFKKLNEIDAAKHVAFLKDLLRERQEENIARQAAASNKVKVEVAPDEIVQGEEGL